MDDFKLIHLFYNPDKSSPFYREIKALNDFLKVWEDNVTDMLEEGIKVDVYKTEEALKSIECVFKIWLEEMKDEIAEQKRIKEQIKEQEAK